MSTQRLSGILLHPTALPGTQEIGTLGQEARHFVDALVAAGQKIWQILPLGPAGYADCPYSCYSAFAGNPLLIDFASLVETGDLTPSDLPPAVTARSTVDFTRATQQAAPILERACLNFSNNADASRRQQYDQFCTEQRHWLEDYVLFQTLRAAHNFEPWQQWPKPLRLRNAQALEQFSALHSQQLLHRKLIQFFFFEQWFKLKHYANERGVQIFGDVPIFVAENSADVWANQRLFHLDDEGQPTLVAGVPPDYFSATGQRWGNPLYNWEAMAAEDYAWWQQRFDWNLAQCDLLRVDHFRGFAACWAIPADHETAEHGSWINSPGQQLFDQLQQYRPQLPLIAEDLGIITPDVTALRERYSFPGMKILQFAFDSGADNPYLPHNLTPNSVIYTGTHDNNTTVGWWRDLSSEQRQRIKVYLGSPCRQMPWPLIETAFASVSYLAIVPMQDILALPASSRFNTPGTTNDNWHWRMLGNAFSTELQGQLKEISTRYGRNTDLTAG